jgi:four helix bundle protein
MHKFKQLKIWIKSIELVEQVYELTSLLPSDEKFGLKSQIQRSAISIPSNIAEGSGRSSDKEFAQFLSIAIASSFELETQLILTVKLKLLKEEKTEQVFEKLSEIQKMTIGFKEKLRQNNVVHEDLAEYTSKNFQPSKI